MQEAAAEPESAASSQIKVRELFRMAHLRGLEPPSKIALDKQILDNSD